jgi:hypothetical protein
MKPSTQGQVLLLAVVLATTSLTLGPSNGWLLMADFIVVASGCGRIVSLLRRLD